MEALQHTTLRLGVEVDQDVAADDEIEVWDGSILDEIVASEDHRPAQRRMEHGPRSRWREVTAPELLGHRSEVPLGIQRLPRLGQRLFIHIGCVQLHPADRFVDTDRLRDQHRDGVGFLSGRAARRPDPDRIVGSLGRHETRDDLRGEVLPGLRVAEETRQVHEDRVEQMREFLWFDLEAVDVRLEVGHTHRGHALADPSLQRRTLVPGEIEAPVVPEELEQGREGGVRSLRRVALIGRWTHPDSTSPTRSRRARGIFISGRI